uniref:Uncharacterized protein n=1 Tax=Glossina austeni TaxID=7395 RepID=A0A1A9VV70_GLOAU
MNFKKFLTLFWMFLLLVTVIKGYAVPNLMLSLILKIKLLIQSSPDISVSLTDPFVLPQDVYHPTIFLSSHITNKKLATDDAKVSAKAIPKTFYKFAESKRKTQLIPQHMRCDNKESSEPLEMERGSTAASLLESS